MLFCAIVLQTSVAPLFFSTHVRVDLILLFILAGAIIDGFAGFLWWAIFAGIIFDLLTYTTVGVHALIFLLVVYFVSFFSRRFSVEIKGVGLILFALFVIVATLLSRAVMALMATWEMPTPQGYFTEFGSLKIVSIQILYNMLLFPLAFVIFKKTKKFFTID